jgi:PD-(D/E)XK nuclease superfamily protein
MSEIHADAFEIGLYRDCARKFDLRINRNLVSKDKSPGRSFGSVLHKAREVWRKGIQQGLPRALAYQAGRTALETEYIATIGVGVQVDERRSLENAKRLFEGYVTKFVNHGYEPIHIEVPFDLYVGQSPRGHEVYRTGIIDEFCNFNGRPYVLDFKTASPYPGAKWFDGWRTSDQFMGYVWSARQLYGEAHGVIVHGVWVKTPAKTTRAKYKFEDYFTADIITFTDAQLDEWKEWFLRTVDRKVDDQANGEFTPNWGSACKAYGSTCDYFRWCSSDAASRPLIEPIYYEKVQWQPLADERLATMEDEAA